MPIDWGRVFLDLYKHVRRVAIETVVIVTINHVIHWVVCKYKAYQNKKYAYGE